MARAWSIEVNRTAIAESRARGRQRGLSIEAEKAWMWTLTILACDEDGPYCGCLRQGTEPMEFEDWAAECFTRKDQARRVWNELFEPRHACFEKKMVRGKEYTYLYGFIENRKKSRRSGSKVRKASRVPVDNLLITCSQLSEVAVGSKEEVREKCETSEREVQELRNSVVDLQGVTSQNGANGGTRCADVAEDCAPRNVNEEDQDNNSPLPPATVSPGVSAPPPYETKRSEHETREAVASTEAVNEGHEEQYETNKRPNADGGGAETPGETEVRDPLDSLRTHARYRAQIVSDIEELTGDFKSHANWTVVVAAMCSTPTGHKVLMEKLRGFRMALSRVGGLRNPGAWLNRALRNECANLKLNLETKNGTVAYTDTNLHG